MWLHTTLPPNYIAEINCSARLVSWSAEYNQLYLDPNSTLTSRSTLFRRMTPERTVCTSSIMVTKLQHTALCCPNPSYYVRFINWCGITHKVWIVYQSRWSKRAYET